MSAATARPGRAAVPPLTRRDGAATVFAVAMLVAIVHALDDAFVHRGPGLGIGQHALAGAIALVAAVAAIAAFPALRPGLRSALALWFGVLAIVNGALHANHVAADRVAPADVTGLLALAAGAVLVALGAWIPWRHRGAGPAGPWRRRSNRALAVIAAAIAVVFVLGPMSLGVIETHKWREPIGAAPRARVRERRVPRVRRPAPRRLVSRVAQWGRGARRPRRRRRPHRRHGARPPPGAPRIRRPRLRRARPRRERGQPERLRLGLGQGRRRRARFLRSRPDVDPRRIGGLGLSTGADVLVEAGAQRRDLAAIVADGTAAGSFEDWRRLRGTELGLPPGWVMFTTIRVLSGDAPGPPLQDLIARTRTPTLLISAGTAEERDFNVLYDRTAKGPVEHWNLPGAHHTAALRERPRVYERRVLAFLDRALRPGRPIERTP